MTDPRAVDWNEPTERYPFATDAEMLDFLFDGIEPPPRRSVVENGRIYTTGTVAAPDSSFFFNGPWDIQYPKRVRATFRRLPMLCGCQRRPRR